MHLKGEQWCASLTLTQPHQPEYSERIDALTDRPNIYLTQISKILSEMIWYIMINIF